MLKDSEICLMNTQILIWNFSYTRFRQDHILLMLYLSLPMLSFLFTKV